MKQEEWRDIPEWEGCYQVSNKGRVKSLKRFDSLGRVVPENIRSLKISKGYYAITLSRNGSKKGFWVHQLVAIAFLGHTPCGFKKVVNHKNFDKLDNRVENLEIVTNRENSNQKHLPSSSRYVGVRLRTNGNWEAQINVDRKSVYLGSYKIEEEAAKAYQDALKAIEKSESIPFNPRIPTSKYVGVSKVKNRDAWCAQITVNGKRIYIGYYHNEEDASKAFQKYKRDNNL